MSIESKYYVYASSLRTDIQAAGTQILPRRTEVLHWLNEFLHRAEKSGFHAVAAEIDNLTAIDGFIRDYLTPGTARVSLH
jgi:hypothetical protein